MKQYTFDHYYKYDELKSTIKELAQEYPQLIKISSICKTLEEREVFVCKITNYNTGDILTKPAYYVDGNHHAGEVTGSMAAIHLIITLVQGYGKDEEITKLLDTTTIYVLPRISPDGAEAYLTSYEKLRSVNRPYPFEKPAKGLHPCDMDNDGVIRIMRVKSKTGVWKEMDKDPRIMVKRLPADTDGVYYNVYPEGYIEDYDGINVYMAEGKWNLDFNRNYPFGWFVESRQPGAGAYPLSNPENKAVVDFVLSHPNICSAVTYHTTGGCYIYPPGTKPEAQADKRDMQMFKDIGKMATQETGYGCFNIFDVFLTDTVNYSSGAFDDWMYMTQGIPTYTAELWDLSLRAGVENLYPRTGEVSDEENAQRMYLCFKWIDENVKTLESGKPIKEWESFTHPQLGEVEIGSVDFKYTYQNCPPEFLQQEVEKNTKFCLKMAKTTPKLEIEKLTVEKVADDIYNVKALVSNNGYMPTFVSNEARTLKVDENLIATLTFSGEFVNGEKITDIGHLEGFSGVKSFYSYDNIITQEGEPLTKELNWIIKADKGQEITLNIKNKKSGISEKTVII